MGLALSAGCGVSVHQVAASSFEPYASLHSHRVIHMTADQQSFLGFDRDTRYVEQAWDGLKRRCPGGQIVGITAETSTQLGFFSWTNRITLRGVCVQSGDAQHIAR